jgi:hypothetical protein
VRKVEIATHAWTEYAWDHRNRLVEVREKTIRDEVPGTVPGTFFLPRRKRG